MEWMVVQYKWAMSKYDSCWWQKNEKPKCGEDWSEGLGKWKKADLENVVKKLNKVFYLRSITSSYVEQMQKDNQPKS